MPFWPKRRAYDSNPAIKVEQKISAPMQAPVPPPIRPPVAQSPISSEPWTPVGTADRGSLLSSIRQGTKLKKAKTNDRSGPLI